MTSSPIAVGSRVLRGPDWMYEEQDGGDGHLGTVKEVPEGRQKGWVAVIWDRGNRGRYRVGAQDSYDLLLWDNAPAGVKHQGVKCDECMREDPDGLPLGGIRWKCMDCPDYDLCTPCYMAGRHDHNHAFRRFTDAQTSGVQMSVRIGVEKQEILGLFPGAHVERGANWKYGEQDGGPGKVGMLKALLPMKGAARSAAIVTWDKGRDSQPHDTEYRVGYLGFVDLKCGKAAKGGEYFRDHLPILGKEEGIRAKDKVCITLDKETFSLLQEEHGLSTDDSVLSYFGLVTNKTDKGFRVKFKTGLKLEVNPLVLEKIPAFKVDDRVRVSSDKRKVKRAQEHHGGWNSSMKKSLGKTGTVVNIDKDGDVKVNIGGNKWTYNPCSLIPQRKREGEEDTSDDGGDISPDSEESDDEATETEAVKEIITALASAAKEGDVDKVKDIMKSNKELVNNYRSGRAPLHTAAAEKHLDIVRVLVEEGEADVDIGDHSQRAAPIHYAAEAGAADIVQYLLEHGANVNAVTTHNTTALHVAVRIDNRKVINALLQFDPDFTILDSNGETPLHKAARKDSEAFEMLMAHERFSPTIKNKKGFNLLHYAAYNGKSRIARLLAEKYPDIINMVLSDGHMALHIACANGHHEVAKALLEQRTPGGELVCEVDAKNKIGQTACAISLKEGKSRCAELLLASGTDITLQEEDGDTYLHEAARALRDGEKVESTPTLQKICRNYKKLGVSSPGMAMLCLLVEKGADITVENKKSKTPLDYVRDKSMRDALRIISKEKRRTELQTVPEDEIMEDKQQRKTPHEEFVKGIPLIDRKELQIQEQLGQGGFGIVHRAKWHGTDVAVKILTGQRSKKEDIQREIEIMSQARHEYMVDLRGVCIDEKASEILLAMQLIEGPSLHTVISKKYHLSLKQKVVICRQLFQVLLFIHARNILHLDIKPSNILLDKTHKPHLCDLGLSSIKKRDQKHFSLPKSLAGTTKYLPPESLDSAKRRQSPKQDIWCMACSLLELFTGRSLWEHRHTITADHIRFLMTEADVTPPILGDAPEEVQRILAPCFNKDPDKRPDAATLLDQFDKLSQTLPDDEGRNTLGNTKDEQNKSEFPCAPSGKSLGGTEGLKRSRQVSTKTSGYLTGSSVSSIYSEEKKNESRSPDKSAVIGKECIFPETSKGINDGKDMNISTKGESTSVSDAPTGLGDLDVAPEISPGVIVCAADVENNTDEEIGVCSEVNLEERPKHVATSVTEPTAESGITPVKETVIEQTGGSLQFSTLQGYDEPYDEKSQFVDNKGAIIFLEKMEISLEIPAGALGEGVTETVTVKVVPENDNNSPTKDDEIDVCPVVECLPSGLKFQKRVTIRIGHCAVLRDPANVKTAVYICEDSEKQAEYQEVADCPSKVDAQYIYLYVDHFTRFAAKVKLGESVEGKLIYVTSYTHREQPFNETEAIVRTYLSNKTNHISYEIEKEETALEFRKAHPKKLYTLYYHLDNMQIKCIKKERILTCEMLFRCAKRSIDFTLTKDEYSAVVTLKAGQFENPEGMIDIHFSPPQLWKMATNRCNLNLTPCNRRRVVPIDLRKELNLLLRNKKDAVADWRNLAERLDLGVNCIEGLSGRDECVVELLDVAEKEGRLTSLRQLLDILIELKRDDCVQIVNRFINEP